MGSLLNWAITTAAQYPLGGGVMAAIVLLFPFATYREMTR